MQFLRTWKCLFGLHAKGRYCANCGQLLDQRALRTFRVRSIRQAGLDLLVKAVDESHAKVLAGGRWHPENLAATWIDEVKQVDPK